MYVHLKASWLIIIIIKKREHSIQEIGGNNLEVVKHIIVVLGNIVQCHWGRLLIKIFTFPLITLFQQNHDYICCVFVFYYYYFHAWRWQIPGDNVTMALTWRSFLFYLNAKATALLFLFKLGQVIWKHVGSMIRLLLFISKALALAPLGSGDAAKRRREK